MYMAYFEPRIHQAVNASPLRFDIMKFCCTFLWWTSTFLLDFQCIIRCRFIIIGIHLLENGSIAEVFKWSFYSTFRSCFHCFEQHTETSLLPLRFSDRLDIFVSHIRPSMAQWRSFASIGPSLWNRLPLQFAPPSSLVTYPHLSLTSKPVFSFWVKCTGSTSDRLYVLSINVICYN